MKVKVPATTANLGPGFDVLGASLTLYNELEVSFAKDPKKAKFVIEGEGKKYYRKMKVIFYGRQWMPFSVCLI